MPVTRSSSPEEGSASASAGASARTNAVKRIGKKKQWTRQGNRLFRVDPKRRATHVQCSPCAKDYIQ